jgi:hypothetical protein
MTTFEPIVIKNVLDDTAFETLMTILYSNKKIYWNFFESQDDEDDSTNSHLFRHYIIRKGNIIPDSIYANIVQFIDILHTYFNKNLNFTRICANFLLQESELIGDPKKDIHGDSDTYDFYTAIFYTTDSNCDVCDTVFTDNSDKKTVVGRFTPIKNTMILFDTRQCHRTLSCCERIVITFTFYVDK